MKKALLVVVLVVFSLASFAQMKLKWLSGNFDDLRDQHSLRVVFNYDSLVVDKFKSHQAYIDYNKSEEEYYTAGAGEIWERLWRESLEKNIEAKFLELFQKYCGYNGRETNARYVLIVHLKRFITRKHGWIDGEFVLIDSKIGLRQKGRMAFIKVPTDCVSSCEVPDRIAEGYAKAGKSLGQYISRLREGEE